MNRHNAAHIVGARCNRGIHEPPLINMLSPPLLLSPIKFEHAIDMLCPPLHAINIMSIRYQY